MAHNNNSRKSVGLCNKLRSAVSPFGSRIRRQPPPETKPVHILHQSSGLSKSIPVEFNHIKKIQNSGQEFGEREIVIVRPRKDGAALTGKVEKFGVTEDKAGRYAKSRSNHEDDENKFSDYINKVKSRMMKTVSNVDRSFSIK